MAMALTNIPMTNPDIVTGVSLALLFAFAGTMLRRNSIMGFGTLLIAHITFDMPYVILSVMPKLTQMDPDLQEAALDLGCTPGKAFFLVVIHEILPGILSGALMAFTMSLDDFAVTFFTRGTIGLDTLSTYIYTDARKGGLTPELRPLMTLIFLVVLILLLVINLRQAKLAKQIYNKQKLYKY